MIAPLPSPRICTRTRTRELTCTCTLPRCIVTSEQLCELTTVLVPWACRTAADAQLAMTVPFESMLEEPLAIVQARLRITPAPQPKAHASTGVTQQRDEAATHDTDLDARRSGATGS
jgi:hypothetical protein